MDPPYDPPSTANPNNNPNKYRLLAYCSKIFNLSGKKKIVTLIIGLVTAQFALGVFTLLLQVPLFLALLHQAVAIILLITMVISLKENKC